MPEGSIVLDGGCRRGAAGTVTAAYFPAPGESRYLGGWHGPMSNDDLLPVSASDRQRRAPARGASAVHALISVGLALNFGAMRLVNLSHGDWLIVAALPLR